MADVNVKTRFSALVAGAVGSKQIFEIAGFGIPKAAIFILSGGPTDTSIGANLNLSIGFTDGVNQNASSTYAADNVSSSLAGRLARTDRVIVGCNGGDTPVETVGCSFSQWTANGVEITRDLEVFSTTIMSVILINGDDVAEVYAGSKALTGTAPISITDPTFEPSLVFQHSACYGTLDTPNGFMYGSFGIGINDGPLTQKSAGWWVNRAVTAPQATLALLDSFAHQAFNLAVSWAANITSYDPTGFTLTPTADPVGDYVFYLAIRLTGSPDIALFDTSIPTTGNYIQNFGFEPDFGFIVSADSLTTRNSAAQATDILGVSFSSFAGSPSNQATICGTFLDDSTVTNTVAKSIGSSKLYVRSWDNSGWAVVEDSHVATPTGWDFTLTINPPIRPLLGFGLALGVPTTTPGGTQEMYTRNAAGDGWDSNQPYVNVGGTWVAVDAYENVGGVWVPVYEQ